MGERINLIFKKKGINLRRFGSMWSLACPSRGEVTREWPVRCQYKLYGGDGVTLTPWFDR